ncbi:thiosulfate oxidation carrier complex protein SoxZ [Hyphomicrobium methylovorum]|uniref:thiosulfate oxidation carrier complex protein SoxZ n=1 Tax=Hyphomicrobium methylovorum TaxID=84 RepID=UPI0015E65370|nr:thiosulfate oxidation carrier complex protein SoxZ [Hyphomicrobium methylovorum]MBA2124853.1 thiosulfate oxidation carrier complex protein SoxZ [Hyphomicrobium methylovorum]
MTKPNPRIKLPESAKAGEIIEVKTLITHIMETGNRHDKHGRLISRNIINAFVALFGDVEVFRAEFGPGVSANPYVAFQLRVPGPGAFDFAWTDDQGVTTTAREILNVVT